MNQVPTSPLAAAHRSAKLLRRLLSTKVQASTRLTTVQDRHQEQSRTVVLRAATAVRRIRILALHRVHHLPIPRVLHLLRIAAAAARIRTVAQVTRTVLAATLTRVPNSHACRNSASQPCFS